MNEVEASDNELEVSLCEQSRYIRQSKGLPLDAW